MRYQVYLFDLDGTLLDTLSDLTAATNAALAAYGCPARTREEVKGFVGNGIRLLIERAAPAGTPYLEEIFSEFRTYYAAHCFDHTRPYPGVEDMLREIVRRGGKAGIVSNKADFAVQELTGRFFKGLVQAAAGENEGAGIRKKPAPDLVYSVLGRLGEDGTGAVYVGDSEVDIQTAKNAGLPCISVTWGFKTREFLLANGATRLVDRPEEICR
ncbi:MAG TPA: HAD family hydrolase [Candidatus Scatosoma pullistercoris]|uniref:HAD family hydrolase n=1 Tax=Candidatus Scatosoma pullistercoris TaxID=2840934 RepID=A0A9D1SGY6_9FIRM|nr:HAD family hydrolase [Candidatus Scatosoma pullistercoris]